MEGGDASIPVREVKSPESKIQDWNIPPQFAQLYVVLPLFSLDKAPCFPSETDFHLGSMDFPTHYPLVMTNIVMENSPFIDGLPFLKWVDFPWRTVSHNQRVTLITQGTISMKANYSSVGLYVNINFGT